MKITNNSEIERKIACYKEIKGIIWGITVILLILTVIFFVLNNPVAIKFVEIVR